MGYFICCNVAKKMLQDNKDELTATNVPGEPLEICSMKPVTGFYRDGCCNTGKEDVGSHTVCAVMTAAFLDFSKSCGNDLSTPVPAVGFPGLKPGDRWCLCAPRWQEAFEAGHAPAWCYARLRRGPVVNGAFRESCFRADAECLAVRRDMTTCYEAPAILIRRLRLPGKV